MFIVFYIAFLLFIALILLSRIKIEKPIEYGRTEFTLKGDVVKSNAERMIADFFTKNNIRYKYEHRIWGISRPDFYLLDYDVYVEYWGLVNADDERVRKEYVKKMKWKMAQYHSHNIPFISIYPWNLSNFDWVFRKRFEKVTGQKLN